MKLALPGEPLKCWHSSMSVQSPSGEGKIRKEQEEEFSGYESHINYIKDF